MAKDILFPAGRVKSASKDGRFATSDQIEGKSGKSVEEEIDETIVSKDEGAPVGDLYAPLVQDALRKSEQKLSEAEKTQVKKNLGLDNIPSGGGGTGGAVSSVNGKTGAVTITAEELGALTEHQDISGKVDKVKGKQLSTEDFTTEEKQKLAGIPEGGGGGTGENGATFTPNVSAEGEISWTNDKGLQNPTPVNIKGKDGAVPTIGADGYWYIDGVKTETKAEGQKGDKGMPGNDGADGVSLGEIPMVDTLATDEQSKNKVVSQYGVSKAFEKVDKFETAANPEYASTELQSGILYAGYRVGGAADKKLLPQSGVTVKAFELKPGVSYRLINHETNKIWGAMAVAIKTSATGTGSDFKLLSSEEIVSYYPHSGIGTLPIMDNLGVMAYPLYKDMDITPIYYKERHSEKIYLLINDTFDRFHSKDELYNKVEESVTSKFPEIIKPAGLFDNYDFIRHKALAVKPGMSKNLFREECVNKSCGLFESSNEMVYAVNKDFESVYVPLEFNTYYTISGYEFKELGAYNDVAKVIAMGTLADKVITILNVSDLLNERWLNSSDSEVFFYKDTNIYSKDGYLKGAVHTFKTPMRDEVNVDNIGVIINISFKDLPQELKNQLQIEKGTVPTEYEKAHDVLSSIFGYPIPNIGNKPGSSSESSAQKPLRGKTGIFFGDSNTELENGYVSVVNRILGLGRCINKGKWGDTTRGLCDIVTGLNIRGRACETIDFSVIDFATIQIGTNFGEGAGDMLKDIPNISLYDIPSFPYEYSNPEGTVKSATLNNAEDYFRKCFGDSFFGNLALSIEYIRYKNPNLRLYIITIPQSVAEHKLRRQITLELAEYLCVPVIDAAVNCGMDFRSRGKWSENYSSHPNQHGIELWGAYIANELNNRYYLSEAK